MIQGRKFVVAESNIITDETFVLQEGLQQGSICSPVLFNLFFDMINLFELNKDNDTYSIAFADDTIIYAAGKNLIKTQNKLQQLVDNFNSTLQQWNLKINPEKCETIILKRTYNYLTRTSIKGMKEFKITALAPGTENRVDIPHKDIVKYLGLNLDYLIKYNSHLDIQLPKAKAAFQANSRLFRSRYLNKKAKLICYQLLIRPILTYASPIWWNISASAMERLRKFERQCLRSCMSMYRSEHSNRQKYVSNLNLYNAAKITRIDSFILKLTRNYFKNCYASKNTIIKSFTELKPDYAEKCAYNGNIPPHAFPIFDSKGLIQDENNTPIIYHVKRNKADKKLLYKSTSIDTNEQVFRYSTSLPEIDTEDPYRITSNYWWDPGDKHQLLQLKRKLKMKQKSN